MNIIINQKRFLTALRVVEKVVSKNTSLPILNTVLLKTDNGSLKLSATNLEIGINYWIGAKVEKDGEVAVPAKIFSDFISNISDEKIKVTSNKNVVSINSEHYKTQILGMDTKDFPIIPKIKKDNSFKINTQVLKNSLANVLDSTSLSETRPELSGVYVNALSNKIEFAATDSFRLSEKLIPLKEGISKSFIIPRNTVIEIIRTVENMDEDINISVSENQIFVHGQDFELISRLIDGRYPEYKKVIPDKFISLVRLEKSEFEKNIRMASVFSSSISDIKLKVSKDTMEISAKNSDRGEITSHMSCDLKSSPFEILVNYHYLLDGLKTIPTGNVIMEFTGDGSPLVIKPEEKKDQTYVIMPLRN
ncbi:MAG: DNA polymerase III subunit beta [Candidatus Paceibacterota bacterium]